MKPLGPSQHSIVLRGLREALNWSPIMLRDARLSDSGFDFVQVRLARMVGFRGLKKYLRPGYPRLLKELDFTFHLNGKEYDRVDSFAFVHSL